jgi:hypothetical protein
MCPEPVSRPSNGRTRLIPPANIWPIVFCSDPSAVAPSPSAALPSLLACATQSVHVHASLTYHHLGTLVAAPHQNSSSRTPCAHSPLQFSMSQAYWASAPPPRAPPPPSPSPPSWTAAPPSAPSTGRRPDWPDCRRGGTRPTSGAHRYSAWWVRALFQCMLELQCERFCLQICILGESCISRDWDRGVLKLQGARRLLQPLQNATVISARQSLQVGTDSRAPDVLVTRPIP